MIRSLLIMLIIVLPLINTSCNQRQYPDMAAGNNKKDSTTNDYFNYYDSLVNYYVNTGDGAFTENIIIENNYINIQDLPDDFHQYIFCEDSIDADRRIENYTYYEISRIKNTVVICKVGHGHTVLILIRKVGNNNKCCWIISNTSNEMLSTIKNNGCKVIADNYSYCIQTTRENFWAFDGVSKKWSGTEIIYLMNNSIEFAQPPKQYLTDPLAIISRISILKSSEYFFHYDEPYNEFRAIV